MTRLPGCAVRDVPGLKKKPSTSELIERLKLCSTRRCCWMCCRATFGKGDPAAAGALLKNEADVMLFERLAFNRERSRDHERAH